MRRLSPRDRPPRYPPAPMEPPEVARGFIPRGYRGTVQTVERIRRLIREGARDFYIRQKAIDIFLARGVRPKDYVGEIRALYDWVRTNVRYTKDPYRTELLHSARRMLQLRSGDCDDMTILLGSMLEATGHPVRLVLAGFHPLKPDKFSHIYLEVDLRGDWIPLDPTVPNAPMGWAPPARHLTRFSLGRGPFLPATAGLGSPAPPADPDALYQRFQGRPPDGRQVVAHQRVVPPVVTELGELVGVIYRTAKGSEGKRNYIHFMESPPTLAVDPSGTQLYIIGGKYRVTQRGIEG